MKEGDVPKMIRKQSSIEHSHELRFVNVVQRYKKRLLRRRREDFSVLYPDLKEVTIY